MRHNAAPSTGNALTPPAGDDVSRTVLSKILHYALRIIVACLIVWGAVG